MVFRSSIVLLLLFVLPVAVVTAESTTIGSNNKPKQPLSDTVTTPHYLSHRHLQDFDLDAFTFTIAGIDLNADINQALCPDQWQAAVSCIISDCPQIMVGVCPPWNDNNQGILTTSSEPTANGDEAPTCSEVGESFCNTFVSHDDQYADCCLVDCEKQWQSLIGCVIEETTGVDRSGCMTFDCPMMTNLTTSSTTTTTTTTTAITSLDFIDDDIFNFSFAGIDLSMEVSQELCPSPWQDVIFCVISNCPHFLDVCPEPNFANAVNNNLATSKQTTEVPSWCSDGQEGFCSTLIGSDDEYPGCCLVDCAEQIQALATCVLFESTGEDISDCSTFECPRSPPETGSANTMIAPTMAPTDPTFPPSTAERCYTNLDAIYSLISDDDKLFQQKRFVICPGTVMEIGFLVPGAGVDQGQTPIVPRSNTEFLCGEDGKSENNCIIRGGDFGVIAVPVFFRQDLTVNNVQIKGFTFEGQVQYASFVATAGDISFIDCIVRDSANFGPMVFSFDSTLNLGRRLEEAEEFDSPWDYARDYITKYREGTLPKRRLTDEENLEDQALLQGADRALQDGIFEGTIKDCQFNTLQQVERKLGVEFGVISIKTPDHIITMENCTFQNNQYGNQELTPIGYAVLVQGAEVTLNGLCFVDNDFRGSGVVLLEITANPFQSEAFRGNYATLDDDLDCQFAAWFETEEDRRNSIFSCVDVQTNECGGEPIASPASTPADLASDDQTPSSCQAVKYACADSSANLYGTFGGDMISANTLSGFPVVVTYSKDGLLVEYSSLSCGNILPIAPILVAPGALEWRERIETGINDCVQGGQVSLTQSEIGSNDWKMVWIGQDGSTSIATLTTGNYNCTAEEIEADNLPIHATSVVCEDPLGNPYGTFVGELTQTDGQTTIPVEVVYSERGLIVTYPSMSCGNLLPIVPSVSVTGSMEWNGRIEYGVSDCLQGGRGSLTRAVGSEWEFFWFGGGITSIGRLQLEPAVCISGMDGVEAPGSTIIVEQPLSIAPSGGPSAIPSSAPTSNTFSMLLDFLKTLPVTQEGTFDKVQAPQYQAALWLADEDAYAQTEGLEFSDDKMLQRYTAATFYFATGGNNWKICGWNSPSCGDTPWLSEDDECDWFSIDCEEGTIVQINFPATGNDLIGEMPPEMSLLSGLKHFLAPENSLQGDLDLAFNDLTTLRTVAVPDNHLEGTIPTGILETNPDIAYIDLGGNQFDGPLPAVIAGATKLSDLKLNGNLLTGTIPAEIGNLSLLTNLEVQTNELVGTIPDELFSLNKLKRINIAENEGMSGSINPLIAQLTGLNVLQLGFTGLGGTVPEQLFLLTDLSELNLQGAEFSGTIPESLRRLNASLMDLFLNDNDFTGRVPEAFDYLTALETLQIQGNQLTGSISVAVCAERGLRFQQLATLIVDCVVECNCCDNCEE